MKPVRYFQAGLAVFTTGFLGLIAWTVGGATQESGLSVAVAVSVSIGIIVIRVALVGAAVIAGLRED